MEDQKGAELLLQGLQGMCLTLRLVFPMDLRGGSGQQDLEDVHDSTKKIVYLHQVWHLNAHGEAAIVCRIRGTCLK